jgi:thiol:disulfide interchange protein
MKAAYRPLVVIGGAVLAAALMMMQLRADRPERVTWPKGFAAAQARAQAGGGPMLAYFTATWCGPCQKMKGTTFADERVESALHKFSIVKVDVDEEKELAMKYHAESVPMFVILDNDGNVKRETAGYMNADEFLAWLNG